MTDPLDLIDESVIRIDAAGIVRAWNLASTRLYGWSSDEVRGRPLAALFDAAPTEDRGVRRSTKDGHPVAVAIRRHGPADDGSFIETGRALGAEREARATLNHMRAHYRLLFEALGASFWDVDFNGVGAIIRDLKAEGVTDLRTHLNTHPAVVRAMMAASRVLDVNSRTVELFGCGADRNAFLGPSDPFWPEESNAAFCESIHAMLARQPILTMKVRLRRLDGSIFPALLATCEPAEALRSGHVLIAVMDLTDSAEAQSALDEKRAQLARAAHVAVLGEVAATIAHELNQPLTAIAANAAASIRWLGRDPPDTIRAATLMTRIATDAERASRVIASVRQAATSPQAAGETIDPGQLVRSVATFLDRELKAACITLSINVDAGVPDLVGNRTQLQQMIANLVTNAVQSLSELQQHDRRITMSCRAEGARVVIAISDNGPGFPPEAGTALFDSFFTTRTEGMGLGLAIARTVAERHGGNIVATSDGVSGATFTVTLAVNEA